MLCYMMESCRVLCGYLWTPEPEYGMDKKIDTLNPKVQGIRVHGAVILGNLKWKDNLT